MIDYDVIIFGILAGLVAACVAYFVRRRSVGRAVNAFFAAGATSPEAARTAAELDVPERLLRGDLYGRIFVCANEFDSLAQTKKKTVRPTLDMTKARFYIPESKRAEAEVRFTQDQPKVWTLILGIAVLCAAFVAVRIFAPELIRITLNSFGK